MMVKMHIRYWIWKGSNVNRILKTERKNKKYLKMIQIYCASWIWNFCFINICSALSHCCPMSMHQLCDNVNIWCAFFFPWSSILIFFVRFVLDFLFHSKVFYALLFYDQYTTDDGSLWLWWKMLRPHTTWSFVRCDIKRQITIAQFRLIFFLFFLLFICMMILRRFLEIRNNTRKGKKNILSYWRWSGFHLAQIDCS